MLRSFGHVEPATMSDADRGGRHVVVAGENRRRRARLRASSRSRRDQAGAEGEIALLHRRRFASKPASVERGAETAYALLAGDMVGVALDEADPAWPSSSR